MKANSEKPKCIKFLKVSKWYNKPFNIGNTPLENIKEFTYCGITINGAGSFQPAMRDLSDKRTRAIFSLNSRYKLTFLTKFIKCLIGVIKSTTNMIVHGETGHYPLTMFIKLRTVKLSNISCHKISIYYLRLLMSMKTQFLTQINRLDIYIYVTSY